MPLPIDPYLPIYTPPEIIPISGAVLQPFFDSGEVKALMGLLASYSTEVIDPKIETAINASGITGDKTYRHVQGSASSVWNVTHNLNKRASVTVVDSGGSEVEGDILFISDNQVQLLFSAPFSGEAYFN